VATYADGTRAILVRSHDATDWSPGESNDDWLQAVDTIDAVTWSRSSQRIYFLTAKWAVSKAVFRYDLATGTLTYLIDGNGISLSAESPDVLKIDRHLYFGAPDFGSYDATCTCDGNGHEIAARVISPE
jgi:hypothetical protein